MRKEESRTKEDETENKEEEKDTSTNETGRGTSKIEEGRETENFVGICNKTLNLRVSHFNRIVFLFKGSG
jgi:hypothetical protein